MTWPTSSTVPVIKCYIYSSTEVYNSNVQGCLKCLFLECTLLWHYKSLCFLICLSCLCQTILFLKWRVQNWWLSCGGQPWDVYKGHIKNKCKASSQTCPQEQLGECTMLILNRWALMSLQLIFSLAVIIVMCHYLSDRVGFLFYMH